MSYRAGRVENRLSLRMEGGTACLSLHLDPAVGCERQWLAAKETDMSKTYEYPLRTQGRVDRVLDQRVTGHIDYVRLHGVKDEEITRLGVDCVSCGCPVQGSARSYRISVAAMTTTGPAYRMTPEQRELLRKQIDARVRERVERARSANAQANAKAQPSAKAQASARAQARAHAAGSVTSPVVRKALGRPRLEQSVSLAARAEVNRSVRALRAGRGGDRTRFPAT